MLGKRTDAEKGQNKVLLRGGRHWTLSTACSGSPLPCFSLHPTPFPLSLGPTRPWALVSSPDLHAQELFCGGCELETEAGRCQDVPLMFSGAERVIWLFSQQQKLPRKGGKLFFFAHFVSHVSDLASIVLCVFSQLKFQWLVEIFNTNVTLNVFSPRLLLQSLGFEGRDLTKENEGTLTSSCSPRVVVLHHVSPSAQLSCWACIHHSFLLQLPKQFGLEVKLQSSLPHLIEAPPSPHPPHGFMNLLINCMHASGSGIHLNYPCTSLISMWCLYFHMWPQTWKFGPL